MIAMVLSKREESAYNEIKTFVQLARSITSNRSVGMWDRLINNDKLTVSDDNKRKCVMVFRSFCEINKDCIDALNFDEGVQIVFIQSIFIDMHELVSMASDEDLGIVREYLLALSALLVRDSNALALLSSTPKDPSKGPDINQLREHIDTSTSEGQFISELVGSLGDVVGENGLTEGTDPQAAMMQIMMSGNLMGSVMGMKDKMESGEMSMSGMMTAFAQVVKQFEAPTVEEVSSVVEGAPKVEETPKVEEVELTESVD